jgi:hypothetical protein
MTTRQDVLDVCDELGVDIDDLQAMLSSFESVIALDGPATYTHRWHPYYYPRLMAMSEIVRAGQS